MLTKEKYARLLTICNSCFIRRDVVIAKISGHLAKKGDRNTTFFHQKAVWRARKNKIKKLKDNDGAWKHMPTERRLQRP
jgi:hypothetical protein